MEGEPVKEERRENDLGREEGPGERERERERSEQEEKERLWESEGYEK